MNFNKGMFASALLATALTSGSAMAMNSTADDDPWHPPYAAQVVPPPRFRYVGVDFSAGVPDGAALGLVLRPGVQWMRFTVAGTYNGLAPGVRAGLTFDPIRFPVAPTLTLEEGYAFPGNVPGAHPSPRIDYDYTNLLLGLEFGSQSRWRFYLRGGYSWVDVHVSNFQNVVGNVGSGTTLGNPTLGGWLTPAAKLGFSLYF